MGTQSLLLGPGRTLGTQVTWSRKIPGPILVYATGCYTPFCGSKVMQHVLANLFLPQPYNSPYSSHKLALIFQMSVSSQPETVILHIVITHIVDELKMFC